jgi:hypothetical protein
MQTFSEGGVNYGSTNLVRITVTNVPFAPAASFVVQNFNMGTISVTMEQRTP